MRQAGTWDIWLQCLHSEQISPLARKCKGNYKVLKIIVCIGSWEQIMDKIQKDQKKKKIQLELLMNWEEKQGVRNKSIILFMHHPPCTQQHLRVDNPPKLPLWPDSWTHHTLTPYKEPVRLPPSPVTKGTYVTCFYSPLLQQGPQ